MKTTWFWAIPLYDKAPSIFLFLALHSPKRQRRSTWLPIIKSGYPSRNTSASPLAVHQFFTGSCKWDLRARWKGRANRQLQNLFRKKQATKSALFLGGGEKWSEVMYAKDVVYKGKHSQVTMYWRHLVILKSRKIGKCWGQPDIKLRLGDFTNRSLPARAWTGTRTWMDGSWCWMRWRAAMPSEGLSTRTRRQVTLLVYREICGSRWRGKSGQPYWFSGGWLEADWRLNVHNGVVMSAPDGKYFRESREREKERGERAKPYCLSHLLVTRDIRKEFKQQQKKIHQ